MDKAQARHCPPYEAQYGGFFRSRCAFAASIHHARSSAKRGNACASALPPSPIGLPSADSVCAIGPTAIVLEITTMPISDSVPCQASRGAGAGETPGRIAGNGGGTPEPFLEEMIGEVLQARLDAPIIFAGDEHKAVGVADLAGELFQRRGRLALRIFLVHPVQHRQADRLGVDQFDIVAAAAQALDDELREPDAHAVGAVGAVEHENAVAHDAALSMRAAELNRLADASISAAARRRKCKPGINTG